MFKKPTLNLKRLLRPGSDPAEQLDPAGQEAEKSLPSSDPAPSRPNPLAKLAPAKVIAAKIIHYPRFWLLLGVGLGFSSGATFVHNCF